MPRPNGYQSLHTSVISESGFPFEVQIRTEEMHRPRGGGHRRPLEVQGRARRRRARRAVLRLAAAAARVAAGGARPAGVHPEPEDRPLPGGGLHLHAEGAGQAAAARRDAGRLRLLRSTPTSAHQCVGARVNGRMVPLRTLLKNGDIVEIVTQAKHKPSRDWLNFVVTSQARNKIKHFLEAEEKERAVDLGRRLLEKELRRFGLATKTLLSEPELLRAAAASGMQKAEELLAAIGFGKLQARQVARQARAGRGAEGASDHRRRVGRAAGARGRQRQDQGARRRRPAGRPRALLQPDPRREDRRLHHPRARASRSTPSTARTSPT